MFFPYLTYYGAALALKLFSLNELNRRIYRMLGNVLFKDKHSILTPTDVKNAFWLYDTIRIQNKLKGRILDLGTGWTHFHSVFLRFFLDDEIVLFDIQDNRNLQALKKRMSILADHLLKNCDIEADSQKRRINKIRELIRTAGDFQCLYDKLNLRYVLSPKGTLEHFHENEFDVIFSMDVLEHIPKSQLEENSRILYRMLKPGGLFIHQIGLDDHIAHYAPKVPQKNYLRYTERAWALRCENRVQYVNRLQLDEYQDIFGSYRFRLESSDVEMEPDSLPNKIAPRYAKHQKDDLAIVSAKMVFMK